MANVKAGGLLKTAAAPGATAPAQKSVAAVMNGILDQEGMRRRFDELLGKRAPQFLSAVVSLVNSDQNLMQVFYDAPVTIIQAALKAATFDLPIDPNLGYAYIVPFRNRKQDGSKRMEATFIMGYKGMMQLAYRTGMYKNINAVDVREGELVRFDRLTEEFEFAWILDEEERAAAPIVGYVAFFELTNGMRKTIYMSKKEMMQHEQKYRKGQYMGKGWRDDFESMALKTVIRKLLGKWGVMSIDYQTATPQMMATAEAIAKGEFDDEKVLQQPDAPEETVETVEQGAAEQGEDEQKEVAQDE